MQLASKAKGLVSYVALRHVHNSTLATNRRKRRQIIVAEDIVAENGYYSCSKRRQYCCRFWRLYMWLHV